MELQGNIRVFCRTRPVLGVDGEGANAEIVVDSDPKEGKVSIETRVSLRDISSEFDFDASFPPDTTQDQVYDKVRPFVISAVDGYDVCLFAYGQTGSGKTHTMDGGDSKEEMGIYARALETMFSEGRTRNATLNINYSFEVSVIEIYQEVAYDLLNKSGKRTAVELRQRKGGGVFAEGLTHVPVGHPTRCRP